MSIRFKMDEFLQQRLKMDEFIEQQKMLETQAASIRANLLAKAKSCFFDVQIDCPGVILPAHKYVLSSRCNVLAEQLSTGASELDWTAYEDGTCIALLRWIYTDKIVAANITVGLGLLRASHHFQLVSLFEICEKGLSLSVNEQTAHRIYAVATEVGANRLMEKCLLEFEPNFSGFSAELQTTTAKGTQMDCAAEVDDDGVTQAVRELVRNLHAEVLKLNKISTGYGEYDAFSDIGIRTPDGIWNAHSHVLGSRSEKIRNEVLQSNKEHATCFYFEGLHGPGVVDIIYLRWLYTDYVEFNDLDLGETYYMILTANYYQLSTLYGRCEDALVKKATIMSCATVHGIATAVNSITVMNHCSQLIAPYRIDGMQSHGTSDSMDVNVNEDPNDSLCEMTDGELPTDASTTFLTLNDDCLLRLFRYLPLVDLASVKDTCKRLSQLADQSFKIYREKSITISSCSMFADFWVLKHFGKQLTGLDLKGFYTSFVSYEECFKMIAEFTGDKLNSISLNFNFNVNIPDETLLLLENVLKRVEAIQLHQLIEDRHIGLLLDCCENLKEVHLEGEDMALEPSWCCENWTIKSLTLSGIIENDFVVAICEMLPNLECLYIEDMETTADKVIPFDLLENLKRLKIDSFEVNYGETFQNFESDNVLEYLHLKGATINVRLAEAFAKLPLLKELIFDMSEDFDNNVQMILSKTLVNVEKLTFIDCDTITFDGITNMIENLLHLKQLSLLRCLEISCVDRQNYVRLVKERDLEIILSDKQCALSIEAIGNDLSTYVRITADDTPK